MNQKSSLRKIPQSVSQVLTANKNVHATWVSSTEVMTVWMTPTLRHRCARMLLIATKWELSTMHPTIIGLDLAKHVFQADGVDAAGKAVLRKKLRRSELIAFFAKLPSCVVGIEICDTAHYWGRELTALGHQVKLMPAAYVKPYVKRGKNDEADAEATCGAVTRADDAVCADQKCLAAIDPDATSYAVSVRATRAPCWSIRRAVSLPSLD